MASSKSKSGKASKGSKAGGGKSERLRAQREATAKAHASVKVDGGAGPSRGKVLTEEEVREAGARAIVDVGERLVKRQIEIPGTERKVDPELDALVSLQVADGTARANLGRALQARIPLIMAKMVNLGINRYRWIDGEQQRDIVYDKTEELQILKIKGSPGSEE